jgi:hypothetical protein
VIRAKLRGEPASHLRGFLMRTKKPEFLTLPLLPEAPEQRRGVVPSIFSIFVVVDLGF